MNTLLKIPKGTKVVIVSDLHLGHDRGFLLNPRFDLLSSEDKERFPEGCLVKEGDKEVHRKWSVEQHQEWFIEQWTKHIDEDTIVVNLGDACFNDAKRERFDHLAELPCKAHYFLWGNHNSGSKQAYDLSVANIFKAMGTCIPTHFDESSEIYPMTFKRVTFVGRELTVRVGRQEICFSHFAKRIWDHMSRGSWNLHGHSHGNDVGRNLDEPLQKALDVGVENALRFNQTPFFTLNEIETIMETKTIKVLDHHDGTENPS